MSLIVLLSLLMAGLVMLVLIGVRLINRIAERHAIAPGQSAVMLNNLWHALDRVEQRVAELESKLARRTR